MTYFQALYPPFQWKDWGIPQNISVIVYGALAETRTEYLQTTNLKHRHFTNLLGVYWKFEHI
jgi:hypothetical protein